MEMDIDGIISLSLETANYVEVISSAQDDYNALFINYAAVAWHEMRRAWRGDRSVASQRKPRKPTMSWSKACQDLCSSEEPVDGSSVPLAEMVEFLVEEWEESL